MSLKGEHRFSGSLAEEYDLITLAYPDFEAFQRRMIDAVARAIEAAAQPVRILEIGTGNGFTTRMLVDLANGAAPTPVTITSIDNDPQMVSQAREHIHSSRCSLHEADALAYLQDAPEGEWDIITSAFTIHNFEVEYRQQVEREIYRVLSSGGLFANADKYAPDGPERFEALAFQVGRFFDAFLPAGRTELLRKWVLHNIDDQSPRYVMLASEALIRMRELGFRNVEITGRAHMQAVCTAWKS